MDQGLDRLPASEQSALRQLAALVPPIDQLSYAPPPPVESQGVLENDDGRLTISTSRRSGKVHWRCAIAA